MSNTETLSEAAHDIAHEWPKDNQSTTKWEAALLPVLCPIPPLALSNSDGTGDLTGCGPLFLLLPDAQRYQASRAHRSMSCISLYHAESRHRSGLIWMFVSF